MKETLPPVPVPAVILTAPVELDPDETNTLPATEEEQELYVLIAQ